jgi:proteic killer suppression protein
VQECAHRGSSIEITFRERKLQRRSNSDREGRRAWGRNWPLLKRRLAQLAAAANLAALQGVPGHCHALKADRSGQFAVHLWGPFRLIFEPADESLPYALDGELDIEAVTQICILAIEDYHDD